MQLAQSMPSIRTRAQMYRYNTRLNACSDDIPSESRNHIAKPNPSKSQSRIAVKEGPAVQALPAGRIRSRECPESTGRSTAEVQSYAVGL